MNDKAHILKNIYTVRLLDISGIKNSFHDAEGKLRWINVLQDDISWSAEFVVPDFDILEFARLRFWELEMTCLLTTYRQSEL